ncbi:HNH endonuclease [Allokutzneria oryzae]|uniref:HNH endonuclease n=1 Tax=Allokutzneria oryzae TaxID=1378989 RepID=A0ABV5ZY85_9PSEU
MGSSDLTAAAVLAAVHEFDRLGREAFLARYGYHENRWYLLKHDGREYDVATIVGAAYGYLPGGSPVEGTDPLPDKRAKEILEGLTFSVQEVRGPAWTREEIILACDLLKQNGWRALSTDDDRVIELSKTLQKLGAHPAEVRGPKYRNLNGVKRKTADLATRLPGYPGKQTRGNRLDSEVLLDFLERPEEMEEVARGILRGVENGEFEGLPDLPDDEDGDGADEGRLLLRRHLVRERNRPLRNKKINSVLREKNCLECEVCGFDFEKVYGDRGARFAECHHAVPLHVSGEVQSKLDDLVILCSNCHRMIHRGRRWLTPPELRELVLARRERAAPAV